MYQVRYSKPAHTKSKHRANPWLVNLTQWQFKTILTIKQMSVYCKEWQNSCAFLSKIMKIKKKNWICYSPLQAIPVETSPSSTFTKNLYNTLCSRTLFWLSDWYNGSLLHEGWGYNLKIGTRVHVILRVHDIFDYHLYKGFDSGLPLMELFWSRYIFMYP